MPSFDIVSKTDMHELANAIDQTNREINTRFDFKGSLAKASLEKDKILLVASTAFQIKQIQDILQAKLAKRHIDVRSLSYGEVSSNMQEAKQEIDVQQGLKVDVAKDLVKIIKEANKKVQASIQGDQVRVTGKKRDDLQDVIALLKDKSKLALQFENFRD